MIPVRWMELWVNRRARRLRAFQKANGLKGSGTLDAETAAKLGIEKGTASGVRPKESPGMGKGQASPMQKEPSPPTRQ